MKIFSLTLDIRDENNPKIERSISVQGKSIVEVLCKFQIEMIKYQLEIHTKIVAAMALQDNDIPF